MKSSAEILQEFKKLYLRDYGEKLSDKDAKIRLHALGGLLEVARESRIERLAKK